MVDMDVAEYKLPVTGDRTATWKSSAFQYVDPPLHFNILWL